MHVEPEGNDYIIDNYSVILMKFEALIFKHCFLTRNRNVSLV